MRFVSNLSTLIPCVALIALTFGFWITSRLMCGSPQIGGRPPRLLAKLSSRKVAVSLEGITQRLIRLKDAGRRRGLVIGILIIVAALPADQSSNCAYYSDGTVAMLRQIHSFGF